MHRRKSVCQAIRDPFCASSHPTSPSERSPFRQGRTGEDRKPNKTPDNHNPNSPISTENPLDVGVVGDGGDGLGGVVGLADEVSLTGHDGLALQVDVDTLGLGLTLLDSVLLDTVDELLTGARVLDVLDADADALLDVAVVDALVQEDTDRRLGHVVDNTGLAVVDLVGHTVHISAMFFTKWVVPSSEFPLIGPSVAVGTILLPFHGQQMG